MDGLLITILLGLGVLIGFWQYHSYLNSQALLIKVDRLESLLQQQQAELLRLIIQNPQLQNENSVEQQIKTQSKISPIQVTPANNTPNSNISHNEPVTELSKQNTPRSVYKNTDLNMSDERSWKVNKEETLQKIPEKNISSAYSSTSEKSAITPIPETIRPTEKTLDKKVQHIVTATVQSLGATEHAITIQPPVTSPKPHLNREPQQVEITNQSIPQQKTLASLIWEWLITGNPLAKIGILLLFFGLSYLLKFSIENELISASTRLIMAAGGCFALFAVGWMLKKKNLIYALILQGGGIGGLYITIFAATKIYTFIPSFVALALMTLVCLTTIVLAVFYRAISLAILASLGGYLAPILLSTGSGNYVALFSYYLILSIGILIISHWQVWRLLNLIGFGFTFGIGLMWAIPNYNHVDYIPCQLFLITNWLIFGFATELSTLKNKLKLNISFDATLLFGTPLIGFLFQYRLASEWEYGVAIASLFCAISYYIAYILVLKRYHEAGKLLALAFLLLAITFATLAIPFAFSAKWTSMVWAIEGIMILLFSTLQRQKYPALSGTTLIGVSLIILLTHQIVSIDEWLMLLMQNITIFAAAVIWYRAKIPNTENKSIALASLIVGVVSWLYSLNVLYDVAELWNMSQVNLVILMIILITSFGWLYVGKKMQFPAMASCSIILWPTSIIIICLSLAGNNSLVDSWLSGVVWVTIIASGIYLLKENTLLENQLVDKKLIHLLHLAFIALFLITELFWLTANYSAYTSLLYAAGLGICSLYMIACYLICYKFDWAKPYQKLYWQVCSVIAGILVIMVFITNFNSGTNIPLRFIPLLNPMDVTGALSIFVLYYFTIISKKFMPSDEDFQQYLKYMVYSVPFMLFLWGNSILIRGLAFIFDIDWNTNAILSSKIIQTILAIIWTITALITMLISTRKNRRKEWFVGGILLALVILKLFLVDISLNSGLHKAIAFIAVAVLILLIGYFSPLPPKKQVEDETDSHVR